MKITICETEFSTLLYNEDDKVVAEVSKMPGKDFYNKMCPIFLRSVIEAATLEVLV